MSSGSTSVGAGTEASGAAGLPVRHGRLRRRALIALVVVATLIAFILIPLRGGAQQPARGRFGDFAGYVYDGRVTAVSASWDVPEILPGSPEGRAATWIGAQGAGARFLQVGVTEVRRPSALGGVRSFYTAFVSDTPMHYLAHRLFSVGAGDRVAAAMTEAHRRWTLSIRDLTSGHSQRYVTSYGADIPLGRAEWTQEDPRRRGPGDQHAPYPQLGRLAFGDLRVDSHAPAAARVWSTWMSLPGLSLGPGSLIGGRFTLVPRTVGRDGAQYLRIIQPLNRAAHRLWIAIEKGTADTAWADVRRQAGVAAQALSQSGLELAAADWPAQVRPLVAGLIARNQILRARVDALGAATSAQRHRAIRALFAAQEAGSSYGHRIRRALGTPELIPDE